MKRCVCFKKIPARDTYCENCNIKFYNLNKAKSSTRIKENNKMIDEPQVEEKVEGEVSTEADEATTESSEETPE